LGSIVNGLYRPASLANTSALDTWVFEYVGNNPTDDGYDIARFDNPNIKKVSMFEYWNISRAGATIADLSLTYGTGSYIPPNIGNVANLKVVKWNSATTQWELATGATGFSQSGTNTAGTVTGTQITSFSPHTLGSPDFDSPLPIELVYFNARLVNNQVELKWETAQEIDNDFFTVERASDPELFEPIIHVKGHGTTNARSRYSATDARPLPGTTYYRLKQTDFNGRFSYSKPQAIQYDGPDFVSLHVYPNPSEGKTMMIEVTGLKDETEIPVEIVNAHGQKVYANIFEVKTKGMLQEKIVFGSPLNSGIYIIKAGPYLQMIKKVVVE
jgi:fibronectin-binding autotransporter adhesin